MIEKYHIPLSDEQLMLLGKLGAVWSQMDYFLLVAIEKMTGMTGPDIEVMFDKRPTGPRIHVFKHLSNNLSNDEARELAERFCKKSNSVLGRRNHLTHGIWGLFSPDGSNSDADCRPACYFPGNKKGLIYAAELTEIVQKATEVSSLIAEFVSLNARQFRTQTGLKLYMGYGPPEGRYTAPQGSMYMDLAVLGHSPK